MIAVPQGNVEAEYTINGKTVKTKGSAYHGHNWGNAPMQELINHWNWSRTEIGPYTAINAYLPIVMNTREELNKAFRELNEGTFIKA